MEIRENLVLGIDLGIASCGWAVIDRAKPSDRIVAMGVRTFDAPETAKERTPTNQLRRQFRGMRRVIHRRAHRMDELRRLFQEAGLLATHSKNALWIHSKDSGELLDPWKLRAGGLERKLSGEELAVALGHIAKHRGFKSNSKRKSNEPASDDSKMLKAIEGTRERMKTFRTVGEMFANDPEYAKRKRNRDGDYTRSILRDDQLSEVHLLFDPQRAAGNCLATPALEQSFIGVAFRQLPIQDSEKNVGDCPFEEGEKRASRFAPSFEKFRFLSRLTSLRLETFPDDRTLTREQIGLAIADFGSRSGMTFHRLRKILDLDDGIHFAGIPHEEERERDVVKRTAGKKGQRKRKSSNEDAGKGCMEGTKTLRDCLGEAAWNSLKNTPEQLDKIAFVLTFRDDKERIRTGLAEIGVEPLILKALMKSVENGDFSNFRRAGHISAKACRKIIPYLRDGMTYDKACKAAGYDHAKRPEVDLDKIGNPIARKAMTEAIKQVRAIVHEYGLPGRIHVELARDVGKSKEERDEISRGIEKRNKEKDRAREQFKETVGREPSGGEDLLRYELWKEQDGRCLYTDRPIHPNSIVASDNSVQVDHILPWSRSGDDSFVNKTLCTASANQEKKGRTPFEWFGADEKRWEAFVQRVESIKSMKGRKKRNYVLKDASILEEKFRPRNLNDTRYATRALLDILARLYPDDVRSLDRDSKEANAETDRWFDREPSKGKVRVASRPGPLTNELRRGWGIQTLKKDAQGKRIDDDRHHAVDALIVAATTQSALQKLTRAFQEAEKIGSHRDFANLDPPWPGFREELNRKYTEIFVSRAERHRARGEAHAATIREINERDGKVYERKSVDVLSENDLERIKDPERNAKLIDSLREWIAAGKPKDLRPLSPKGDQISKVRLRTSKKLDVLIRDGAAERGEMVRADIFRKSNGRGRPEFYLVPVYPHQVATLASPPNKAIQANTDEARWPEMDGTYEFCWSVYPLSFLELTKADGEIIEGYSRNPSRSTGAFAISPQNTLQEIRPGIGARTLLGIRKFSVDRLGRRYEVSKETRTWRGAVCT